MLTLFNEFKETNLMINFSWQAEVKRKKEHHSYSGTKDFGPCHSSKEVQDA